MTCRLFSLSLTLAVAPLLAAQGPTLPSSPYLESCGTLTITRRTVDTVGFSLVAMPCSVADTSSREDTILRYLAGEGAVTAAPVPTRLILTSPTTAYVPEFTGNFISGAVNVSVAMVNETGGDLRTPSWLFIAGTAAQKRGKWLWEPPPRGAAWARYDIRHSSPDYSMADAPSPFKARSQLHYRFPAALPPDRGLGRVAPGDTTGEVTLPLTLGPSIEVARLRFAVRALRASEEIPLHLPASIPTSLLSLDRLVSVDSVATPFVPDLLRVRFDDSLSPVAQQILLDRIAGRAIGKNEGDLLVQVASAPDGSGVVRAWSLWNIEIANARVRRLGIVVPRPAMEAAARSRGAWPLASSVLGSLSEGEMWRYPRAHLQVEPSPGTSDSDLRLALATVGARPVARAIDDSSVVAELVGDTSYDAHTKAARQLSWLPSIGNVSASPAYNPAEPYNDIGFEPRPPKNQGSAWRDQRVQDFVTRSRLANVHAIRDLVAFPERDLVFFDVIYGSAFDVYPHRTGMRYGSRIGWLGGTDSLTFRWRHEDAYLQGELIDTLLALEQRPPTSESWAYPYATQLYLPSLIVDPTVRSSVIQRCARLMYGKNGRCDVRAVRAAAARTRDWYSLTLLSFGGKDGYGEESWAAQDTLVALAPELWKNKSVPAATWAAIAWSLGRYVTSKPSDLLLVRQMLAHPVLGRRLDILTPLVVAHFPFMADSVADRIPGSDSMRAVMREVLRYPWGNVPLATDLLRRAVETNNRPVLTVLANLFGVPQGLRAEAARHLPAGVIRHYDTYLEPPAIH